MPRLAYSWVRVLARMGRWAGLRGAGSGVVEGARRQLGKVGTTRPRGIKETRLAKTRPLHCPAASSAAVQPCSTTHPTPPHTHIEALPQRQTAVMADNVCNYQASSLARHWWRSRLLNPVGGCRWWEGVVPAHSPWMATGLLNEALLVGAAL